MSAALGRIAARWLPAYAALYVVFLYLPIMLLPIFSVNTSAVPKFPLSGFTWKWYESLPSTPALLDAAWNSLVVGRGGRRSSPRCSASARRAPSRATASPASGRSAA